MKENMHKHTIGLGLKLKEDLGSQDEDIIEGLAATTHPDRKGEILSKNALEQMRDFINDTTNEGEQSTGSYRSVSLYHDWIRKKDKSLDEPAKLLPNAEVIKLDDGHYGLRVQTKLNKYYKGTDDENRPIDYEEVKYRIKNGYIAGYSIEYNNKPENERQINYNGQKYNYIEGVDDWSGIGFARARLIANPHSVIYKEIEASAKEVQLKMSEEEIKQPEASELKEEKVEQPLDEKKGGVVAEQPEPEPEQPKEEEKKEEPEAELKEKEVSNEPINDLKIKTILESQEFNNFMDEKLKVKNKVLKEDASMGEIPLKVKEMNEALASKEMDMLKFKEAVSGYFAENPAIDAQLTSSGIPLHTTLKVKCDGTKLRIVNNLKTKDTLDTDTNTTSYTQSIVEFADLYVPGIIDTFNNQTNLFGALQKKDHLEGGNQYGWRITTSRASTLSVDPDQTQVDKTPVSKLKLRTEIKEYRIGVSVSDYTLHHSRAAIGDLFMIEVEKSMLDLMKDLNADLFTEQSDGDGTKILGLEAVADSAGNTTLYGLTRSSANRLAPDSASDTYVAVGGAVTTALLRSAVRKPEVEGARRGDLRFVMNPVQRDLVFELEDGNQRYQSVPKLGFDGQFSYDGIPVIVDVDCQTDAIFVIDMASAYLVISRAPQLIGLAKVGAAEEAFLSVYLAFVYEQPRRIHMLDTLSTS